MTGPRPAPEVFDRARREIVPARPLETVHRRATRLRRRRRALAVGASGSAVGMVAAVVGLTAWLFAPHSGGVDLGPGVVGSTTARVTPDPAPAGRTADMLLAPSDLGPGGWIRGTQPGDTDQVSGATQVACDRPGAGEYTAPGIGRQQLFRGSTPQGAEWILDEQVVNLDAASVTQMRAVLRGTANGCPTAGGSVVLAADSGMLVTGSLRPDGSVGNANGYALAGSTWISVTTLPGGAAGGIPLPGQARWLLDVTAKAVERATGTRPTTPALSAAAARAAARYVTPTSVLHVDSPLPSPGAAAPGPATAVPRGFLHVADLGTVGGWGVTPAQDLQSSAATVVGLPTCSSVEQKVIGAGAALMYRGSASGGSGEWVLNETVVRLDAAAAAAARTALAAAATCPAVRGSFGAGTRAAHTPTTLVLGFPLPGGATGYAQAWALRDDVLVQLDTLPGGAAGGAELPGGVGWLEGVLAKAVARAG